MLIETIHKLLQITLPSVGLLLLIGKKLILINYSIVIYKTYSPPPYLVTDSMLKLQEVHIRKCYGSKIILKHNLHISSTLLYNKPSIPSSRRSRLKQKFTSKSKSKYDDSFFKNIFQKIRIINRSIETQSQDTHQEVKTSGLEKIQNLVKSKVKSRSIFDSYANLRIDITKPNDELVRSIIKNTKTMNKKRFTDPATSWLSNFSQKQIQELQDF